MKIIYVAALVLSGCAANAIEGKTPVQVYRSSKSRDVVTDCLANRVGNSISRLKVTKGSTESRVIVRGIVGNPTVDFTVRDEGTGSVTELRRAFPLSQGKSNAETCFL